ncbi:hypothetical protein PC122_g18328 [Phytophthora cactorum]|nr:hypothetical protein PC122_g18328 [Phytophthora cactorum]
MCFLTGPMTPTPSAWATAVQPPGPKALPQCASSTFQTILALLDRQTKRFLEPKIGDVGAAGNLLDRLNDKGYRHQPGLKNGGQGLWDSFTMDCGPIMDGTKILAPPSIVPNHLRTPARLPSTWHNNCDGCEKLSREHKYSKRSERKLQGACV